MKKKLAVLMIVASLSLYANEVEDLKFSYRLYETKQYDLAVGKLEEYIKKYPSSKSYDTAINLLAVNYYWLKEYDKAKIKFEKLNLSEFKDEATYFLILIGIKQDSVEEAKVNLDKISNRKMKIKASYQLANYFYKKNNFLEAEKLFLKLTSSRGSIAKESLLKLGIIYFKTEQSVKTTAMLLSYIDHNSEDEKANANLPLVYYILANTEERLESSTEAVKYYEKVFTDFPESEYAYKSRYSLAKLYYRIGMLAEAENISNDLIDTEYKKEAYGLIAEIAYDSKEYAKAELNYKKQNEFVEEKKEKDKVNYKAVLSVIKQKKYDQALDELKLLKESDYKSEYYYYTVFILFNQKEYGHIYALSKEILKTEIEDQYYIDIMNIIADSDYSLGKYSEASSIYKRINQRKESEKSFYKYFVSLSKTSNIEVLKPLFIKYKEKYENGENQRDIYLITGNTLVEKGKTDEAELVYKEYLKKENDETFLNNLSSLLLKNKKYEELLVYLEKRKENNETLYLFGISNQGLGNYKKSLDYYNKIIEGEDLEYKEESYLRAIDSMLTLQRYEAIIDLSSQYLKQETFKKYRAKIIDKKAISYFKQKRYKDSALVYRSLAKYEEFKDYTYFMRGEIYYNEKNFPLAKKYYEKVILEYKDSDYKMVSLYWLIKITYQEKEYDSSLSYIKFFLKNYEKSDFLEDVLYYLGNIYVMKNQTELALLEYEKVLKITTNDELKKNLIDTVVSIYFENEKYEEALAWIKEIKDENDRKLWLARVYQKENKTEEALKIYKEIAKDEKIGDEVSYYLGNYYLEKKQYVTAREYFNRILDYDLSEFKDDAIFGIGLAYEEEALYKKALTAFMRIKLLYETSNLQDVVHIKIAENYEKISKTEEALKTYVEFVEKYPGSQYYELILERLIASYWNNEKKEEAIIYYKKLQEKNIEKSKEYDQYFSTGGTK